MNALVPIFTALPGVSLFGLISAAPAQVVVSEIHYHPVEEAAFDNVTNYTPAVDLGDDVHEFVEIHNRGAAAVDLGGWTFSAAVDFTFPAGTTIPAGGYKVVAKDVGRLQSVYSIGGVLGPYAGTLSNRGDTVRLRNAAGVTVDSVSYSAAFPWAMSADSLGAQDRFTGLNSADYQYKGRSLQRVSATANSNDPANWLASPLSPGPTPGGAQAVTRAVPQPVVVAHSRVQTSDSAPLILAGSAVTVACSFSATDELGDVRLEWFVDDVNSTAEVRGSVAMTALGGGIYSAPVPAQAARAIVRYRFLANRGSGSEVVSPRADDPAISQVGAGGARQPWHGYFVHPSSGRSGLQPNYDLFLSTANLAQIRTNAQQGGGTSTSTRRVTLASAAGLPRERPHVGAADPHWNGTVPAVFAHDGVLHDVQIRFHGSRYHRYQNANNLTSFKLHFPEILPFRGRTSWFVTGHGAAFAEATTMNRLLGLPASTTRPVSWYFNANAAVTKLEQGEYDGEMLEAHHALQQQLDPGAAKEANGDLYKVVGNRDPSQNNNEGPYTKGDLAPLSGNSLSGVSWTQLQRYEYTFALQNNGWKGPGPFRSMHQGLWAARGDSPAATTLANNATALAATRAWFNAHFDIEATLTSLALLQWIGIWDDTAHNQFFWRRANGKWVRLGWDYDDLMTTSGGGTGPGGNRSIQTIYAGEAGFNVFDGTNWWKDSFFKCFRAEFKQRLWELNNSFFDPANLTAQGLPNAAIFAAVRQANVNSQLALGSYTKPARPVNASPAAGGVVVGGATLTTSTYAHPSSSAHAATRWEIREAAGDYEIPVLRLTTAASLASLAIPFDALAYGRTYWWRATHLDSQGHPSVVSAETSFTWGAATVAPGALVMNEILAVNRGSVANGGSYPDFIEIRNNGAAAYDLTGVSLTDDPALPSKFTFPSGNTLPAGGHLVVWCDSAGGAPGFHSGFGLGSAGQTVVLAGPAGLLDSVTFGPQAPDLSIGRIANGSGGWTANDPTPGLVNSPVAPGTTATLSINEWMAAPAYGEDWFELHNSGSSPVAIGGLYLSDTPGTPQVTRIPALSYIAAGGFTRFEADAGTTGGNHCNFKLSAGGETLVLTAANGTGTLDSVSFGSQAADVSQGCLPDGGTLIASFALTASPEQPNWLPAPVVVNEALARPAAGGEDFIELHNPTAAAVAIGGWWLSDDFRTPKKYQLPAGTSIAAGGYRVVAAPQFAAGAIPFSLGSTGDEVCLAAADGGGELTGYRSQVSFAASPAGAGFGRVAAAGLANGRGGSEFWPLAGVTPGAVNGPARVRPVIFNEVMYHPVDGAGGLDVTATEFIELHNPTNAAADLSGWRLKGDSDFTFPAGISLPAAGYLLLVGFDPADPAALGTFRATYGLTAATPVHGPFVTKLSNNSHGLELAWPDDFDGITRHVNSDRIEYRDTAPWPAAPDGTGTSLQRVSRGMIGNDAANWASAAPSPGAVNGDLYPVLAIWSESPLPDAVKGSAYSFPLTAVGGTAPYAWSLASGDLPAGLVLDGNGVLSGTPLATGNAAFTVALADGAGGSATLACRLLVVADFTDADQDGMPDDWEAVHSLRAGVDDSADDADADGQDNLDEYLAGTDPRDAASLFAITGISAPAAGSVWITWPGIAGKRYRIRTATGLGDWTPRPELIECPATGLMQASVPTGGVPALFLRVAVEP
jgi:hypothetical protein